MPLAILGLSLTAMLSWAPTALAQERGEGPADREAAQDRLVEAYRLLREDPWAAERAAKAALAIDPAFDKAHSFLGWLYNVQLGKPKKALVHYDYLVAKAADPRARADAMSQKGSLLFTEQKDAKGALALYEKAYVLTESWRYADMASNLLLHVDQPLEAEAWARNALALLEPRAAATPSARDVRGLERRTAAREALVKVKLQVATCRRIAGGADAAAALLEGLGEIPPSARYNEALYRAACGEADAALGALRAYLANFKTAAGRNQLRVFIREEPCFKALLSRPGFKELITEEPQGA